MDWGLGLFLGGVSLLAALRFSLPRHPRVNRTPVDSAAPASPPPDSASAALPGLPSAPEGAAGRSSGPALAVAKAPKAA